MNMNCMNPDIGSNRNLVKMFLKCLTLRVTRAMVR